MGSLSRQVKRGGGGCVTGGLGVERVAWCVVPTSQRREFQRRDRVGWTRRTKGKKKKVDEGTRDEYENVSTWEKRKGYSTQSGFGLTENQFSEGTNGFSSRNVERVEGLRGGRGRSDGPRMF